MTWSLEDLLKNLHDDVQQSLSKVQSSIKDPNSKGAGSEQVWLELFEEYLPKRYKVANAFVVDSKGSFSKQIDVVVFDRQYSPFILNYKNQTIIPAESVYAVFESKQTVNKKNINDAQEKIASVRNLYRTSLNIPHAGGNYKAKTPISIIGGILSLEKSWKSPFKNSMLKSIQSNTDAGKLDFGYVANKGYFFYDKQSKSYQFESKGHYTATFLFKLISQLQLRGTVPMIDVQAYIRLS